MILRASLNYGHKLSTKNKNKILNNKNLILKCNTLITKEMKLSLNKTAPEMENV